MSGGSFNYIGSSDPFEVPADLESIRTALAEYPHASLAVAVVDDIIAATRENAAKFETLRNVLHAVEWHRSHDYGPERVDEALAKFNAAQVPAVPEGAVDDPHFHDPR